jgi:acetate kinase
MHMIVIIEPGITDATVSVYKDDASESRSNVVYWNTSDPDFARMLREHIAALSHGEPILAVSARIQWGSRDFDSIERVDRGFVSKYASMGHIMPSYKLVTGRLFEALLDTFPCTPIFAFSETGFFSGLSEESAAWAVPDEVVSKPLFGVRGLSGIIHQSNARFVPVGKTLSIVLSDLTSLAAMKNTIPVCASPGATPLVVILGERTSGDIDAGIVFHLMRTAGYSIYKTDEILKKESGFYGITGRKETIPGMYALYGTDDRVTLAFDVYMNHILKYAGECLAHLRGLDSIVFAGSNLSPLVPFVSSLLARLSFLGIELAEKPWKHNARHTCISGPRSGVSVFLNYLSVSEIMAHETARLCSLDCQKQNALTMEHNVPQAVRDSSNT